MGHTDPNYFRADADAVNLLRATRDRLLAVWRAGGRYDGPPLTADDRRANATLSSAISYLACRRAQVRAA